MLKEDFCGDFLYAGRTKSLLKKSIFVTDLSETCSWVFKSLDKVINDQVSYSFKILYIYLQLQSP